MKKLWTILLVCMMGALLMTGCASNADTLASPTPGATQQITLPSPSPDATDDMNILPMPDSSMVPDASSAPVAGAAGGIETLEDAKRLSDEMEDAVEQLTEVEEAYVVAIGEMALVGVEFDSQYQGEMDERLKKMILSRVQTVSRGVTQIAATVEKADVTAIEQLAETLDDATSLGAIETQARELISRIGVYPQ